MIVGYESFMICGRGGINERVYCPTYRGRGGFTTGSTTNGFYAAPFSPPFDVKIGKLTKPISTSGNYRMGIYTNSEDNFLYPDKLIYDSGERVAATTTSIDNLSVQLRGGECYWIAISFGTTQTVTLVATGSTGSGICNWFQDDGTFGTASGTMLITTGAGTVIMPEQAPSGLTVGTGAPIGFGILFER